MVQNPETEIKKTQLCKCGAPADFIKDYWVAEACVKKEKTYDNTFVASLENTCGILRRRYCKKCLGKVAETRRRYNTRLDIILFFSVFLPFALLAIKQIIDWTIAAEKGSPALMIVFSALTVVVAMAMLVYVIKSRMRLTDIVNGRCSDMRAVDHLIDSLNEELVDWKTVKEVPSTDVVVDGDGRVNYGMERSGFNMKILIEGNIAIEAVRSRFRYPIKEEFEYIRRAYRNADLLDDNLRAVDERQVSERDFDIRGGVLRRYSGCAVEIRIPEGVTEIAVSAFKNSKNCDLVVIPESVTIIGAEAFSGCPAETINIPSCITVIDKFAFYRSGVREVVIPEGVTEIRENAFCECYTLEKVVIPSTCKRIGEGAFKDCVNLVEVELSEGIEAIGDYAFHGCSSILQVNIPDGVYEIGNFAFEDCTALDVLYLPDTIQFMGGRAFDGNMQMTIYGKAGSYAEQYATETRKRFSEIIDKSALPKRTRSGKRAKKDGN